MTLAPYFKTLETASRAVELGHEIGIAHVVGAANKIGDAEDAAAVRSSGEAHGIFLAGEVPLDDELRRADVGGVRAG